MKLLLDTHAFLWWIADDAHLPDSARTLLADDGNEVFLSVAVAWEILIKTALGRMSVSRSVESLIRDAVLDNQFLVLPIQLNHTLAVAELPPIHQDPFDRILVSQAICEELVIVTRDALIRDYGVPTAW
jgi:PIN domain nuclease of toxin-antitoxin system